MPKIIETINQVKYMRQTAKHDNGKRYSCNVTPGAGPNQVRQHTLVLNFLVATNESNIGLGATKQ